MEFYAPGTFEVSDDEVLKTVQQTYHPGDVFPDSELEQWALENGFIKEEPTP